MAVYKVHFKASVEKDFTSIPKKDLKRGLTDTTSRGTSYFLFESAGHDEELFIKGRLNFISGV